MIYVALGANLPSQYGTPKQSVLQAMTAMEGRGLSIAKRSSPWASAPVPYDPAQPDYINAVVEVKCEHSAPELLQILLKIEAEFGRVRGKKNAPRVLDLDLIAYGAEIIEQGEELIVPHPRMQERLFVLKPLEEVSMGWLHPKSGQNIAEMVQEITGQEIARKAWEGAL